MLFCNFRGGILNQKPARRGIVLIALQPQHERGRNFEASAQTREREHAGQPLSPAVI